MLITGRISNFLRISLILPAVFGSAVFAKTTATEIKIELGCGAHDHPTVFEREGPDTQLSVATEGIRVEGLDELVVSLNTDPSSLSWESGLSEYMRKMLSELSFEVKIEAKCSSSTEVKNMWPAGRVLVCDIGDGVSVELYKPKCCEEPGKYGVFTVIVTRGIEDAINATESSVASFNERNFVQEEFESDLFFAVDSVAASATHGSF